MFAYMYAMCLLVFLKGRRKHKMFCKWVQTMVSCRVDAVTKPSVRAATNFPVSIMDI